MSNFIKTVYENCECTYTCGLSLRKFLRLLSVIGMISSIVYITVGACIIVHIVQTEKVEWFPNAYYRIPEENGPVASRIVVPPPSSSNGFEDFEVYRPKQNFHPMISFQPQQQHTIFPVNDDSNVRLGEQKEKAIYYRRNVGLFICLAATLILINFIQLITDVCLFYSTLKNKRSTSFWVYFLLNIILWIMTLICFITIFSGGGIFLLLVFLSGTAIRVYTVYALHELMSDLRKPRASSVESLGTEKEIKPEPRTVLDAEEGSSNETAVEADEATTTATDAGNDDDVPTADKNSESGDDGAADEKDSTSSTKTLQPTQNEDELADDANLVKTEEQDLQCSEIVKADDDDGELEPVDDGTPEEGPDEVEGEINPETECSDELDNTVMEEKDDNGQDGANCDHENEQAPDAVEAADTTANGEDEIASQQEPDNETAADDGEADNAVEQDPGNPENDQQEEEQEVDEEIENPEGEIEKENEEPEPVENEEANGHDNTNEVDSVEPEIVPEEENDTPDENNNGDPVLEDVKQEGDDNNGDPDALQNEGNETPENDSPTESGENEEHSPEMDEAAENENEITKVNSPEKKRKKSKRKRRTKKA